MWMIWPIYLKEQRMCVDMGIDKDKRDEKLEKRAAALRANLKKRNPITKKPKTDESKDK
jgi:hypothetical protein